MEGDVILRDYVGTLRRYLQRLALRAYRSTFPKSLRHQAIFDRRLGLVDDSHRPRHRRITWCHREVGIAQDPREIRDSQRGDCFVVCSGPSIGEVDLKQIAGCRTFAVNGSIIEVQRSGLRPDYYTATDPDFYQHRLSFIEQAIDADAQCFLSAEGLPWLIRQRPELLRTSNLFLSETINRRYGQPRLSPTDFDQYVATDKDLFVHRSHRRQTGNIGFSADLGKGLFCGRTVAFRAIQIAYYIGYRRVFLLGMDLGGKDRQLRCYEEQECRPSRLADDYQRFILPSFEVLQTNSATLGLEVYNLSPCSRLPSSIIPTISLDTALRMVSARGAA